MKGEDTEAHMLSFFFFFFFFYIDEVKILLLLFRVDTVMMEGRQILEGLEVLFNDVRMSVICCCSREFIYILNLYIFHTHNNDMPVGLSFFVVVRTTWLKS